MVERSKKPTAVTQQKHSKPIAHGKPTVQTHKPEVIQKPTGYLILVRHGQRLDDSFAVSREERLETRVIHELDIPLSRDGKVMANTTGEHIRKLLAKDGITPDKVEFKIYTSPYLRCLQTSDGIAKGLGLSKRKLIAREELSEMQIGAYNHEMDIDDLSINKEFNVSDELKTQFLKEFLDTTEDVTDIYYDRDYTKTGPDAQFQMKYPESIEATYERFLSFFRKVHASEFENTSQKCKVVIMVSHGNSIASFMEVGDKDARKKDIIGVGYCCLSIMKQTGKKWEVQCLGDATHVGCGTSEIIPNEDF